MTAIYNITCAGIPLPLLVLYFLWYSFLGWCMETVYCSVAERRFVFRGFLKGPICPIYGFGVMVMVLWLQQFTQNFFLFYLIATVTMSAWEYFVGWLLEVTTHMKYWDYSHRRFNLKGRICLGNSLYWGIAAYAAIFWIHPATQRLFGHLSTVAQTWLAGGLLALTLADTIVTIRHLALTSGFLAKAEQVQKELERQKEQLREAGLQKLQSARLQMALAKKELEENRLLQEAAHHSARFRNRYHLMSSRNFKESLQFVKEHATGLRQDRKDRFAQLKAERKNKKA